MIAYIDDLYVQPEFRRRGAATAVLDCMLSDCAVRGCKSIQVEVGETNVAAIALYSHYGLHPATDGRVLLSAPLPGIGI